MRPWTILLTAAALAGCVDRLPVDAAGARTALPPAPAPPPAATPSPAAEPLVPAAASPADTCGAGGLAYTVGKPRAELPIPVDLTRRRVVCEGCPVEPDVRPERQTIFYDQAAGKVTRATCG